MEGSWASEDVSTVRVLSEDRAGEAATAWTRLFMVKTEPTTAAPTRRARAAERRRVVLWKMQEVGGHDRRLYLGEGFSRITQICGVGLMKGNPPRILPSAGVGALFLYLWEGVPLSPTLAPALGHKW